MRFLQQIGQLFAPILDQINHVAQARHLVVAQWRLSCRFQKCTYFSHQHITRRLRDEHAATLPRFDVMAALHRAPEGLRMSALSGVLRVSNGNVTGIVDRLVAEGMVERAAVAGDRRAMEVRLTAAGVAAFEDMAANHERWIDELLGGMSADEAQAPTERLGVIAEGNE